MAALITPPLVRLPEGEFRARPMREGEEPRAFAAEARRWLSMPLHPNVVGAQFVRKVDGVLTLLADDVPGFFLLADPPTAGTLGGHAKEVIGRFAELAWGLAHIHACWGVLQGRVAQRLVLADDGHLLLWPGDAIVTTNDRTARHTDVLALLHALGEHLGSDRVPAELPRLLTEVMAFDDRVAEHLAVRLEELGVGTKRPRLVPCRAGAILNHAVSRMRLGVLEHGEHAVADLTHFDDALQADPLHPQAAAATEFLRWREGMSSRERCLARLEAAGADEVADVVRSSEPAVELLFALPHAGEALDLALSPDPADPVLIVSGEDDASAWDLAAGVRLDELAGEDWLMSVDVDRARRVLGGMDDGSVVLWRIGEGGEGRVVVEPGEHAVWAVFTPDGTHGVVCSEWGLVSLVDLADGRVAAAHDHGSEIAAFGLSPDGRVAVLAAVDGEVWGVDVRSGQTVMRWREASSETYVRSVGVGGGRVAVPGHDGVEVWSWDGQPLCELGVHAACVALTSDGALVLTGSNDRVGLWRVPENRRIWGTRFDAEIRAVAMTADGSRLITAGEDGIARVFRRRETAAPAPAMPEIVARPRPFREAAAAHESFEARIEEVKYLLSLGDVRQAGELAEGLRGLAGYERHPLSRQARWMVAALGARRTRLLGSWPRGEHGIPAGAIALSVTGDTFLGGPDCVVRHRLLPLGYSTLPFLGGAVCDIDVTATGDVVLAAAGDNVELLRVGDSSDRRTRHVTTPPPRRVAIGPDGRFGLVGHADGRLFLWDMSAGASVREIATGVDDIALLALAPRALQVFVADGGEGGVVIGIDLASSERVCELAGEDERLTVLDVAVDAGGRVVATAGADGLVRVWDAAGGHCLQVVDGHGGATVTAVCLTADGRHLLSAGADGEALIWSVRDGAILDRLRPVAGAVESAAMTPDGRYVSLSCHRGVSEWELDWEHEPRDRADLDPLFDPEGIDALLAPSPGLDFHGMVATPRAPARELLSSETVATLAGHDGGAVAVALTRYGRLALSGDGAGDVRVWDLDDGGELRRTLSGHGTRVSALVVTADGATALSGGADDGTALVWDVATGECRDALDVQAEVRAAAVTADGRVGLTVTRLDARLWDLQHGECVRAVAAGDVLSAAMTDDAGLVLLGLAGGLVLRWLPDHCALSPLEDVHEGDVLSLALTPAGHRALSVGWQDTRACAWDIAAGWCDAEWDGSGRAAALGSDGIVALVGGPSGMAELRDLVANATLATFQGHTDEIRSVALSADAGIAATASCDGTVRVWRMAWGPRSQSDEDWVAPGAPILDAFLRERRPWVAPKLSPTSSLRGPVPRWEDRDVAALVRELEDAGVAGVGPAALAAELARRASPGM